MFVQVCSSSFACCPARSVNAATWIRLEESLMLSPRIACPLLNFQGFVPYKCEVVKFE